MITISQQLGSNNTSEKSSIIIPITQEDTVHSSSGRLCPNHHKLLFLKMCEVCKHLFWQMPKLLCKQMGTYGTFPVLPVPLATGPLQEESLPARAAKGGKKIRAIQHPEASSCKWYFVMIKPNDIDRISTMGWSTSLKCKVEFGDRIMIYESSYLLLLKGRNPLFFCWTTPI